MTNLKYLQKLFFLLLMGVSLCAVQACNGDDDDEAMSDPSKNTTDIAVTGNVDKYGCTYANIIGYANLNQLLANVEIGIEIRLADSEYGDFKSETTNSLTGNEFMVEFVGLLPNTKYKYRSYVKYGGLTHYGEFRTFTTKDIAQRGAVDLGLSVKWAAYNVGANSPEEYGSYYAWGETEEKNDYSWNTYKWCSASNDFMTKYCTNSSYGTVDNKTMLTPEDDVVHVKWGGNWRMPTLDEINELREKCTWQWTSYNEVYGQLVTGPNGNSIFLPAAGYRGGEDFGHRGSYGYFWSATLHDSDAYYAYGLYFYDGSYNWFSSGSRSSGCTVRPVTE